MRSRMRGNNVAVVQLIVFALGIHVLFFNRVIFRSSFPPQRFLPEELSDQPDIVNNSQLSNEIHATASLKNSTTLQRVEFLPGFSNINASNASEIQAFLEDKTTVNPNGIPEIIFFNTSNVSQHQKAAGCLINLDDTIKLAEWLPYHYTVVPLESLVIALDPNTSAKGIRRTLQLINLWKDRIDITLWPNFILPDKKRRRRKIPYVRERQVYFAKQCLIHHKRHNRSWTLLNDNDEYLLFNYINSDEKKSYYHAKGKDKRKAIDAQRKTNIPMRKSLPSLMNETITNYLEHQNVSKCIRLPYITYGGGKPYQNFAHNDMVAADMLSTIRDLHHEQRHGKASKVMIDLRRVEMKQLEKGNGKTIHNPNSLVCGKNGAADSGTDYIASSLRMNHYIGSMESFFERQGDYRRRDARSYQQRSAAVNVSENEFDTDIVTWIDAFLAKVGKDQARGLLAPLSHYVREERQLQEIEKG